VDRWARVSAEELTSEIKRVTSKKMKIATNTKRMTSTRKMARGEGIMMTKKRMRRMGVSLGSDLIIPLKCHP